MKILMLTLQAGPTGVRQTGKVYNVPTNEAQELIAGGFAQAVDQEKPKPQPSTEPRTGTRGRGRTATKPEAGESDPTEPGEDADEA